MNLIKHTEIKSDSQKWDHSVIEIFGNYWVIGFYHNASQGVPFSEIDRAVELFNKQVEETTKFANKNYNNVVVTNLK